MAADFSTNACLASIGPGGIEIALSIEDNLLVFGLQSDRVELKLEVGQYRQNLGRASIGPGGIEMKERDKEYKAAKALQSDRVELKSVGPYVSDANSTRFNRTGWN